MVSIEVAFYIIIGVVVVSFVVILGTAIASVNECCLQRNGR